MNVLHYRISFSLQQPAPEPQPANENLQQQLQDVQREMVELKRHIQQMSHQRNTRSLQNLAITLNTRNCNSRASPWSDTTSVWSSWHDTPPPPYSETDNTQSNEPPPTYDSTQARNRPVPPAYSVSTRSSGSSLLAHRQRQQLVRQSRSFSNHSPDSPDFGDRSFDYYFVSPLRQQNQLEYNMSSSNTEHGTDTHHPDTCHTYVNIRRKKTKRQQAVFSPSFNETSSSKSDEIVFDCVRQLVFDMTHCSDLVDAERQSRSRDAVSGPTIPQSITAVQKNRRPSRQVTNKWNQTIDSDCTDFFEAAMNRPAITHKKKADRFKSLAKQMKQIRKKLLRHGTMQNTNMDTLAVL